MNRTTCISTLCLRTLFLFSLAGWLCIIPVQAEDLKTQSGRTYRDATISRVEEDGLVIKHRFGIVKVAFQNIAAESREKFNKQKAAELTEQIRREEEDRARDRQRDIGQQTHAETAERGRSVMAFEEDNEAQAEAFAAQIHQKPKARIVSNTTETIHVRGPNVSNMTETIHIRGQIVAAGPTGYIVRRASSPRRHDSDLLDHELIFVTSDISEFVQGDYMDVRASAAGEETTFRSYLGQVYPGRFPIYRIIRDRRPEVCVGFRWGSGWGSDWN